MNTCEEQLVFNSQSSQESDAKRNEIIKKLDLFNSKYSCTICRRKLRYKADEIIHLQLKHRKQSPPDSTVASSTRMIDCPLSCGRTFSTYYRVRAHLRRCHLHERPYGCKLCKHKRFYEFVTLKAHFVKYHQPQFNAIYDVIDYENSKFDSDTSQNIRRVNFFHDRFQFSEILFDADKAALVSRTFTLIKHANMMSCNSKCAAACDNNNTTSNLNNQHTALNLNNRRTILFRNSCDFLVHIWLKHMNGKLTCWMCSNAASLSTTTTTTTAAQFQFQTEALLAAHLNEKHLIGELDSPTYKCSVCNCSFDNVQAAKFHLKSEHLRNNDEDGGSFQVAFACSKCEQIYANEKLLDRHFEKSLNCSNDSAVFECTECDRLKFNKQTWHIHKLQHQCVTLCKKIKLNNYSVDSLIGNTNSVNSNPLKTNRIDSIAIKLIQQQERLGKQQQDQQSQQLQQLQFKLQQQQQQQQQLQQQQQQQFASNLLSTLFSASTSSMMAPFLLQSAVASSSNFNFNFNSFRSTYEESLRKLFAPKSATSSSLLKMDAAAVENTNPNVYALNQFAVKCDYCGYLFKSQLELTTHKLLHASTNPKRPFKCHLCLVTFAKCDQLTRHMIVHQATELDSVCQICYSSFSRKQDLDRHMLFHSK